MSPALPSFPLNNGTSIPGIGIGCWMGQPGGADDTRAMIEYAIKEVGYRHIDTAFGYANEEDVGRGIKGSGVPREELYVVTKLVDFHHGQVKEAFELSLKNLGLDYIDLYLMHWPQAQDPVTKKWYQPDQHPTFVETWKEMEKLLETGKVKSIGVSNFSEKNLDVLLPEAKVIPAVNQVEMHPLLPQVELIEYCKKRGILVTAYTPLGRGHPDLVQNAVIKDTSARTGGTAANVIMGWFLKKGIVAIPKSANPVRMKENLQFVEITDEDEAKIDAIHKAPGMHRSLITYHADDGTVFGWTYEQLGWPFKKGGVVS